MKNREDTNMDAKRGEIVIYKARSGSVCLDVRLDKETVWLNQFQMAKLFSKTIPTVNEHLKNIYHEGELKRNSTIRKFRIVQIEGKRCFFLSTILRRIVIYVKSTVSARLMIMQSSLFLCLLPQAIRGKKM